MANSTTPHTPPSPWLEIVSQQVKSLRFGVVQIVVHESKVVQIEKTEKVRLTETDAKVLSNKF